MYKRLLNQHIKLQQISFYQKTNQNLKKEQVIKRNHIIIEVIPKHMVSILNHKVYYYNYNYNNN